MNQFERVSVPSELTGHHTEAYYYVYDATEENPVVVSEYPWGYKLKTERRYWIEHKPKYGSRLCYQTLNPKTDRWCAVKRDTYSDYLILAIDHETEHVKTSGLSISWGEIAGLREWMSKHNRFLPEDVAKSLSLQIDMREKLSKKLDENLKEHKEELKERVPLELEKGKIYKKSEIVKSSVDLSLYVIRLRVEGVRKKCRKVDTEFISLGHISRESYDNEEMINTELFDKIQAKAIDALDLHMRKVKRAFIEINKVTYSAPKGDSIFYGFSQNLFSVDYRTDVTYLTDQCNAELIA